MTYRIDGKKTGKTIGRIILISFGLIIIISSFWLTYILIILGLFLLFASAFLKTKTLLIKTDRIELISNSFISAFTSSEIYKFEEIKTIKFDKGFNNILGTILNINSIYPVITTKPDTFEIYMKNGSWRIINRFGSKIDLQNGFKRFVENYENYKMNAQ